MKNKLLKITGLLLLIISSNILSAQSEFTITKESIGNNATSVKITHENGRFKELLYHQPIDEINVNMIGITNEESQTNKRDNSWIIKNITLPNEELGVVPIDAINIDGFNKTYIYGMNKVIVVNSSSGEFIKSINISKSGTFHIEDVLSYFPKNKLIAYNADDQIIYCVTPNNTLLYIDVETDDIIRNVDLQITWNDDLSFFLQYNQDLNIVYCIVNLWEGYFKSYIKAFDPLTGNIIANYGCDKIIYDVYINEHFVRLATEGGLYHLNPETLEYITSVYTNNTFSDFFNFNDLIVVQAWSEPDAFLYFFQANSPMIIDEIQLNTLRCCYNAIYLEQENKTVFTSRKKYFSHMEPLHYETMTIIENNGNLEIGQILQNDWSNIAFDSENEHLYVGGIDFVAKVNPSDLSIISQNNLNGCLSNDLEVVSETSTNFCSINTIEGTIDFFDINCENISSIQSSISSSKGVYNSENNKLYFIDSYSNYINSKVAIINAEDYTVENVIEVGKYLTDIVYNKPSNRIFILSREEQKVIVVDGLNNN